MRSSMRACEHCDSARVGLVACKTRYPPSGGNSEHIYQLWHRLRLMGYSVRTWGQQADPGAEAVPRTGAGFASLLKEVDLLYIRFPFDNEWTFLNCLRLLANRHIPTICEFNAPLYELTREWPPRTFWSLRHKAALYARNQLLVRSCVDHAICVSDVMGEHVRREFGVRDVSVLPNGGDPELFSPDCRPAGRAAMRLSKDDFVVFWGGSTEFFWSGFSQMIAAAERLANEPIVFAVAGDPTHLPKPLPRNVVVLGRHSYFDMPQFVAGSDVCLCLYKSFDWCPIGYYGSSTKLFAYMACGRPVIASNMGQIAEVIREGHNGLLTDGSPEDIAAKIERLRRDPQAMEAMGRAARETILREYNWQRVAEETAQIIEGLLLASRSRRVT